MPAPVLLVGTGPMAREYARVFAARGQGFVVFARDPGRTAAAADAWGAEGHGTVREFDRRAVGACRYAVVCTAPESLEEVAARLLDLGVAALLLEKPGAMSSEGALALARRAEDQDAVVRVATNRRTYGSVRALRQALEDDPPLCAAFDVTEWADRVAESGRRPDVLARWAVVNAVHVIDTVCFLLGPLELGHAEVHGAGVLPWHPAGATFVGSGRCGQVPVSWCSSWACPGRWAVEVRARGGRYRLAPLEELRVQRHGREGWHPIPPADDLDAAYKPGLWRSVDGFEALLRGGRCDLPDLDAFAGVLASARRLAGYDT